MAQPANAKEQAAPSGVTSEESEPPSPRAKIAAVPQSPRQSEVVPSAREVEPTSISGRGGAVARSERLTLTVKPEVRPLLTRPPVQQSGYRPPTLVLGLRLPTFIAFGVGGLGVSAALASHVYAGMSAQYGDPKLSCGGHCASNTSALSATSTICAGIAAAAIGTGIGLVLIGYERERQPLAPVLKMSFSGNKAAATALWNF